MDWWKKGIVGVLVGSGLAGCSNPNVEPVKDLPKVTVACPDPGTRKKLGPGDTYRDLARAHAEAVNGWSRCYDASEINAGRVDKEGD